MAEPEITNPDGGGTNAPAAEAKAAPAAETSASSKIKFSAEQQDIVNELIDRMFGKGFDKGKSIAQQEFESKLIAAQADNEKLTKQLATFTKAQPQPSADEAAAEKSEPEKKAKTTRTERAEPSPDLQQLMARFDEMQTVASTLKAERDTLASKLEEATQRSRRTLIKETFITASKDINFFDPMEVFQLVEKQIDVDDQDQVVIKNPRTGQPRLNSNMEPMSLSEYLAEFASQKPYLVRASGQAGGTGAGGSQRVESQGTPKTDFTTMSNDEFEAYRNSILAGNLRGR